MIHCHVQAAQVGGLGDDQLELGLERENEGAQHQCPAPVWEGSYRKAKQEKPPAHDANGV